MRMTNYPLLTGRTVGEAIRRWNQAETWSLCVYETIGLVKQGPDSGAPNRLDSRLVRLHEYSLLAVCLDVIIWKVMEDLRWEL
jgi:hypothetical protein